MTPHELVAARMQGRKLQLLPWQIDWLYTLAAQQGRSGARLLEVGTGTGTSLLTMALAAPHASIMTIDVVSRLAVVDSVRLRTMPTRIHHLVAESVQAAKDWVAQEDLILIDADHHKTALDLPWFNRLRVGGLILFHDYSAAEIHVRNAVDALGMSLGRSPDEVMSYDGVGMAGFYRREGERWPIIAQPPT